MKEVANNRTFIKYLVSVIIPVYNSAKYLRQCLESIINQSYKNIEIILINDGSTDNSGEICDAYALSDNRIRVIHTKNKGPAAARNLGIENSKGGFIFFVDSDDFIENSAIELLIENYNKTKSDIIIGDFEIKNGRANYGRNVPFSSNKLLAKQDIIAYVRNYLKKPTGYSLFIYTWGKLFRSSIIKNNNINFNTDLHVFEDIQFNFEYLNFVNSAYFVKHHIYIYCIHNNYVSAGMKIYDNPIGYKLALKSIGEFLKCNGIVDISIIKKEIGHACVSFTIRTMVRFFALNGNVSLKHIYKLIFNMINDSGIRQSLQFYSPSKGDSRAIPMLMRLRLVWPIVLLCKYKARKRYGKRKCG